MGRLYSYSGLKMTKSIDHKLWSHLDEDKNVNADFARNPMFLTCRFVQDFFIEIIKNVVMIYVVLDGRLGNVLFETAAAVSLAKRLDVSFVAITEKERSMEPYKKSILRKIDFAETLPQNLEFYDEPYFHYRALPSNPDLTIKGFFQSEKYFDKELVRQLFAIDEDTMSYIERKYGDLLRREPVSIHVRRGDYLQWKLYYAICPVRYYEKAIRHFPPSTDFFIFSDDIDWCKQNFKGEHFFFSENESEVVDLYMQSFCRHHIISNSTFAWWGAWLDSRMDKRVICPGSWFNYLFRDKCIKDLYPDEWIKLSFRKSVSERMEICYLLLKYYVHQSFLYKKYRKITKK